MNRKQESWKKQIEILERSLADLEEQISMLQPTPPVSLLRRKEHLEAKIKKIETTIIEGISRPAPKRTMSSEMESFLEDNASLIKELARRFQTHFNRIDENKITAYLRQFENTRWMGLALRLLQHIDYVDDGRISDMFREFYYEKLIQREREKAVFTALGGLKDSSYLINYLCSKALDEEEKKEIRFQGLESMIKTRNPQETIPIFLDDNIGSGKQSVRIFQEWFGIAKGKHSYVEKLSDAAIQWLKQAKLFYFVLIGFEEGMENLQKELSHNGLNITIHPAMKTREDNRCFQAGALIFDTENDRLEAKEMARAIGYELLQDKDWPEELRRERSLGYGNSQKLIVFSYNTPTCTLPIFWKRGSYQGTEWLPLFPRRV